jgi:hypothetical protein
MRRHTQQALIGKDSILLANPGKVQARRLKALQSFFAHDINKAPINGYKDRIRIG